MDYHRMRYFLVVAEELHFRRAAERLQLTPSPLSKQIKAFEREMGGRLFVRHYHDVELTPLGAALVEPVRQILAQVAELRALAEHVGATPAALRIGASALTPTPILDEFTAAALALDRHATLHFASSSQELAGQLTSGGLDLALIHTPAGDHELDVAHWAHYPLALAMRADDPLALREPLDVARLADRTVIVLTERSNGAVRDWLADRLAGHAETARLQLAQTADSDAEAAARVRHEGVVALVSHLPGSTAERVFAPPHYVIRSVAGLAVRMEVAVAWSPQRFAQRPRLRRAVALLRRPCRCEDPVQKRAA